MRYICHQEARRFPFIKLGTSQCANQEKRRLPSLWEDSVSPRPYCANSGYTLKRHTGVAACRRNGGANTGDLGAKIVGFGERK